MSYCKVSNCRFANTHVTSSHRCGKCGISGHGQVECGKPNLVHNLTVKFSNDVLPDYLWCKRPKCLNHKVHTTETHVCTLCSKFHSEHNCLSNPEFIDRKNKELGIESGSKSDTNTDTKSDIQSQIFYVNCPCCRKKSAFVEKDHKVYGIDNKCIICDVKHAETFLSCGHVIMCIECLQTKSKIDYPISDNEFKNEFFMPDATYTEIDLCFRNKFKGVDGPVYTTFYAGMACCWLVRRGGVGELTEQHFSHSDDGYVPDYVAATERFINGYMQI